ncbi:hypothetical protein CPC08DRAFT_729317 [Agrocybe pediades]|nr:hypothetical protein CPC08DRAFT_729317 [Agrocybe pediades]
MSGPPNPGLVSLLKPYDLQQRTRSDKLCQHIQCYIYYGESRFRAILAAMLRAPPSHFEPMQIFLRDEVFVIAGYIGMVTAIGRVLDVPVLVRSLADAFLFLPDDEFPAKIDNSLVQILQAGAPSGYGTVVSSYLFEWWKQKEISASDTLAWHNIGECVVYHEQQMAKENQTKPTIPIVPNPQVPQGSASLVGGGDVPTSGIAGGFSAISSRSRGLTFPDSNDDAAPSDLIASAAPASNPFSAEVAAAIEQNMSALSTAQLKALFNTVNAYRRSYEAQTQETTRKALGYSLLMERITQKETTTTKKAPHMPNKKRGALAAKLQQKSKALFDKQKDSIPMDSQWTFGEVLTRSEVMELGKEEDQPTDLETGTLTGEWSVEGSEQTHFSAGVIDSCSVEGQKPPPPNEVPSVAENIFHPGGVQLTNSDVYYRQNYLLAHPEEGPSTPTPQKAEGSGKREDHMPKHGAAREDVPAEDLYSDSSADDDIPVEALYSDGGASDILPVEDLYSDSGASDNVPVEDLYSDSGASDDVQVADFYSGSGASDDVPVEDLYSDSGTSNNVPVGDLYPGSGASDDVLVQDLYSDNDNSDNAPVEDNCSDSGSRDNARVEDLYSDSNASDGHSGANDNVQVEDLYSDEDSGEGSQCSINSGRHDLGETDETDNLPDGHRLYTAEDFNDIPEALFEDSGPADEMDTD